MLLVVEDEPHVASLTCAMLEELGYRCEHVESADAALRLDLHRFVGVVSDVIMPGELDGIGLAKELRRLRPELPILLTTGFAGAPEGVVSAGFPVLKKPYTLEELSVMLRKHFDH
ncbi:response regulator [Microvirga arabica]|uniref:Response regulator n=1 Tax=Microvirga arabica TaxID=1128671 RepID=A0ABV6YB36_9HYPH